MTLDCSKSSLSLFSLPAYRFFVPPLNSRNSSYGILTALGAFFLWGVLPLFWKALQNIPAASIIAHRTLWSMGILWGILLFQRQAKTTLRQLLQPRIVSWHLLSGLLLAGNWLLYVWSTLHDRILEAALGYYLNPFFNLLFGYLLFGERYSRLQQLSIGIALAGVAIQFGGVQKMPWIAITLALSFALYAVVRKKSPLSSLPGLSLETLLMLPLAIIWLACAEPTFLHTMQAANRDTWLLMLTGIATATPLLLFGHATRSISLSTLGILQFLGPTLQFLIGWKIYHEPMTTQRSISFALIWLAIGLYALASRRPRTTVTQKIV